MARYQQSLAKEAVSQYAEVARKHGLTPTQLALAWCASRWFVASTIIGATSLEQVGRPDLECVCVCVWGGVTTAPLLW